MSLDIHLQVIYFFFTDVTTLYGSWPHPWFRNSNCFLSGVVSPTPNPRPGGPGTTVCLAWVDLPGAYAPVSIALRVTAARKPPLRHKAVVLEEDRSYTQCDNM
jgi:hypothetical protein